MASQHSTARISGSDIVRACNTVARCPLRGPIGTIPNPGHAKALRARGSSMRAAFDSRGACVTGRLDRVGRIPEQAPVSKEKLLGGKQHETRQAEGGLDLGRLK